MRTFKLRSIKLLTVCALALLSIGCGSGTNNDQGVSFTLYSFFDPATGTELFGTAAPLSTDIEAEGLDGGVFVTWGIQNNLLCQGIRTQRGLLSFFVEGSSIHPPSTSLPLGLVLGPASQSREADCTNGSIPSSFNFPSTNLANQFVVPPDTMEWINLNRASLPEPPFTMTVHASVVGITTAGDQFTSNELDFFVELTPDNVIPPTQGTGDQGDQSGAATGDGAVTSDGDTSTNTDVAL